ncbi:hypothetical protein ACLKA7_013624 [Drosophila subpalustris]
MDSVAMKELMEQLMQLLLLAAFIACGSCHAYQVPKATIKVNTPQGFEVSIADEPGITLFAFHGKLNAEMEDLSDQTWATDVVSSRNNRWTYHNRQQKLQLGDVLYYWTTVRYNGLDYHSYNQHYTVAQANLNNQSIDLQTQGGTDKSIVINGNPTINIFVS